MFSSDGSRGIHRRIYFSLVILSSPFNKSGMIDINSLWRYGSSIIFSGIQTSE